MLAGFHVDSKRYSYVGHHFIQQNNTEQEAAKETKTGLKSLIPIVVLVMFDRTEVVSHILQRRRQRFLSERLPYALAGRADAIFVYSQPRMGTE